MLPIRISSLKQIMKQHQRQRVQPKKQKARLSLRQNNSENGKQTELHPSNLNLKDIRPDWMGGVF